VARHQHVDRVALPAAAQPAGPRRREAGQHRARTGREHRHPVRGVGRQVAVVRDEHATTDPPPPFRSQQVPHLGRAQQPDRLRGGQHVRLREEQPRQLVGVVPRKPHPAISAEIQER
jgi:hypothetical protein